MSNTKDPIFKKAYSYYSTCMSGPRSMAAYWKAADSVGGSPLTSSGVFDFTAWSSVDALQKLNRDYGVNPLFTVNIGTDLLNTSRNLFLIKAPDVALLSKVASEDDLNRASQKFPGHVLEDDIDEIQSLVSTFNTRIRPIFLKDAVERTGKWSSRIPAALYDATSVQTSLLKDIKATLQHLVLHRVYRTVTVAELSNMTRNKIDWVKLLSGIGASDVTTPITNQTIVGLMVPATYLSKVGKYLSVDWNSKLPSFFAWTLLKKLSPALPDAYFASYYFATTASQIGTKGKERWRACLLDTQMSMPLAVGMMFTDETVSDKVHNKTDEMLIDVKNAFTKGIASVPWLDSTTRSAVREKVKYVLDIVSNRNTVNSSGLQAKYGNVVTRTDSIAEFFLSCVRNLVRNNLKTSQQKPTRSYPDNIQLSQVNAFYDRSKNIIMVLAGILQQPVIYADGPSYINSGKVASILGHELMHGYDSLGWYFDKTGQIAPWWTQAAAAGFKTKANCVENQYHRYLYGGKFVDGKLTLAENIADNGGLKYAYQAYKARAKSAAVEQKPPSLKKLSYDQLFFLAYGQMWCQAASYNVKPFLLKYAHTPNRYRVIGSVSNNEDFAKAYKCQPGSKMNPINKCLFW